MPKIIEASLLAEGKKFAIVASRFNDFITDRLVGGAVDALLRSGAKESDIEIVKVPGCFEIPLVAKKMAARKSIMQSYALALSSAGQRRTLNM